MSRPWVAQYDPGVRPTIDYPDLTLPDFLAQTAQRLPDRTATIFYGARLTYGELQRRVLACGAGLQRLGVQSGDRVAVMLPNMPRYIVAFFGALAAGAVVVPTNPLYTADEFAHQLRDAGATVLITLDALFPRIQTALVSTPVRHVVLTSLLPDAPPHLRPAIAIKQRRQGVRRIPPGGIVHRFEELLRGGTPEPRHIRPDDLAVLQYTGGTTGTSKGAMLSHRNLVTNAYQVHEWQGESRHSEPEPKILCAAPFFHVYGLTVGMDLAIVAGATMILVPRFIPREVAALTEKYRPQLFPGVPTMYVALENLPGISPKQLGSLQICISGAAPLPPEVQRHFNQISGGGRLVEGYGLTEASPTTHCNPTHGPGRPGTVGVPFPDTDARITDPVTWEELPPGQIGEVTVRGPQVMLGYWNRPRETAAVLREGWLHTGDLGTMDPDGYFRIVDRKKDMIIAGGFNIYPREIEDVLYAHPAILEAAVVGVPDAYRGETVKAVIVLKENRTATAAEIEAYCREHLAAFKVPRIIEFTDTLPKSLVGKVLRRELRESIVAASAAAEQSA